eukprot:SAG31_NODE_14337_length_813_cov_0.717087_2_plen_203_part_01
MLEQIKRTDQYVPASILTGLSFYNSSNHFFCAARWLDKCCRPISTDVYAIVFSQWSFVAEAVAAIEGSHPDEVAEMLTLAAVLGTRLDADGRLFDRKGKLYYDPNPSPKLTRTFANNNTALPSAAAVTIANTNVWLGLAVPYCDEVPQAFFAIIEADQSGAVAANFRRHIQTVFLPLVERIADTLTLHAASIEWPPMQWIVEK